MSRISVDVSSARIPVLQVGYQGENEVTDVLFDISSWITEFGEGVAQLRVKRPGNSEEESYVLSLTITDGIAVWTVSETDTFNKGNGKVQLSYLVGNIVKKAVIYPYKVGKSIVGADNPVDPFDSWIERSKAWAIGETLDGNAVPETDETYQNNAKHYAEQAHILGSAQVVLATEQATLATEKATLATEKANAAAASETNAAASEAAVNGVSTQLTTRMSAIETEQSVQSARMDTFTSLPEGSTSGNAELADIRVGANGTTYDTAGNAVRGQIGELKSDLTYVEKNINRFFTLYPEFNYEFGVITSTGTEITNTTSIKTKAFLQFPEGASFSIAEGFKYRIYFYTSKDSSTLLVDSMSGYWHTEPYVIDKTHSTYYAKIQIANGDDSEISDIDSVKNSLTVIYPVTEGDIISRVTNCETEVAKSSISYIPILSAYMESMNSGDVLTVSATFDCNKNDVEEFFANITSFDTLTVAHGGSDRFMGGDVVITNTEVMIKTYNNTVLKSEAHGLTISDFIYVCIEKDDKTNAKVTIMSKSGTYALQTTAGTYYGVNGAIKASTTSELTNATLKYIAKDLSKDTWLFGDSYITLNDNGKYMTQLVNMGFADKICSCGYGGAASANIIFDFRNLTAIAKPKRIVWALGMNDNDGDNSVNANWNAFYNEVRTYCDSNGIELILATIPNTPSVSTANSYKNEIVRASGYRYIDFAKAVNAESDNASWFDGMLSSDNVHPTELGAKVLASRFLMDVPEII